MTETLTICYTLPYSVYTHTLTGGQVLTVQSVVTEGDLWTQRLLMVIIAVLVTDFIFRVVYRQ